MMKSCEVHKRVVRWSVFGAALLFSTACQSVDKGQADIRLPPNSKLGIVIGEDSKLTVYDREGNRVPACNLCSTDMEQKFGPYCEKAPPEANLCDAVTTATVQDVDTVVVMKSHKNPHCVTLKAGGSYYSYPSPCRH